MLFHKRFRGPEARVPKTKTMKTLKFFLIPALLFFLAACTEDVPAPAGVLDEQEAIDLRARGSITKPMKLWIEAITDESLGAVGCTAPFPGVAVPAGGWMQGHATHLGKLDRLESPWAHGSCELILDENWNPVMVAISGSHGAWAGANGDQIWWEGSYESYLDGTFSADLDIVGGTGRFEGATGNVKGIGHVDPVTSYAVGSPEGYITIPR